MLNSAYLIFANWTHWNLPLATCRFSVSIGCIFIFALIRFAFACRFTHTLRADWVPSANVLNKPIKLSVVYFYSSHTHTPMKMRRNYLILTYYYIFISIISFGRCQNFSIHRWLNIVFVPFRFLGSLKCTNKNGQISVYHDRRFLSTWNWNLGTVRTSIFKRMFLSAYLSVAL